MIYISYKGIRKVTKGQKINKIYWNQKNKI